MWDKYKHIISYISVGSGVIDTVADWVASGEHGGTYRNILVVCDPITRKIAGDRVIASLKAAGLTVSLCCFIEDEPLPNEYSVGYIIAEFKPDIDLILGVGSGTINDLCTFVGVRVNRPTAIFGTAPSMDGFAAIGSAMLFDGVKVTPPTQCATAIFCDIDIMAAAPMHMIAAGLGDMLGKLTALADWRLSHVLTGEEMPEDVVAIMESALSKIIEGAPKILKRDPAAIQSITEGLILSGIAMSIYGDSRPASGTEHHLAHFWEMIMLAQGKKPVLHGTKVGLATVIGLEMWREVGKLDIAAGEKKYVDSLSLPDIYERDIHRLYGYAAEAILQTKNPNLPIELIEKHWAEILDIAKSLPAPEDIAEMLTSAGADVRPAAIGLDTSTLRDSVIYARERKKTYTLLQLLGDLVQLEAYADIAEGYFADKVLSGVKCYVLDMDGTIYLGDRLFPYTLDFLKHIEEIGMDYVFFTNNSSQNSAHYLDKLHRMGISIPENKLLMSTHVLLDYLQKQNDENVETEADEPQNTNQKSPLSSAPKQRTIYVAGTKALKADFTAAGYTLTEENPEFVVLGFDTDIDYARLTKVCDFVRSSVPVYGVNMDYNCPVVGGFIPDCGALAAAVTTSTGVIPEFFGKPSRRALEYIIQATGYDESELCFIGDRLYTDIAITSGTKALSVLVLSGETSRDDLTGSPYVPDLVVDDLSSLLKDR